MKIAGRGLQAFVMIGIFCAPLSVAAQENYYNAEKPAVAAAEGASQPKTHTVTSLQKCYESIGRDEALDIQMNFIKPYQECQRRLAILLKKKQAEAVKAASAADKQEPSAERSGGFYRVQKPQSAPDDKAALPTDSKEKKPGKPLF